MQSSSFGVDELVERVFGFMEEMGSILDALGEDEFKQNIESCVQEKLEAEITLGGEAKTWWDEIELGAYKFDRDEVVAKEIAALTRRELKAFYLRYLSPVSKERRFFISAVDAKEGTPAGPVADAIQVKPSLVGRVVDERLGGNVQRLSYDDIQWWRDQCDLWSYVERPSSL